MPDASRMVHGAWFDQEQLDPRLADWLTGRGESACPKALEALVSVRSWPAADGDKLTGKGWVRHMAMAMSVLSTHEWMVL